MKVTRFIGSFIFLSILGIPSLASGIEIVSGSGHLQITIDLSSVAGTNCNSNNPSGFYSMVNGPSGKLYPNCAKNQVGTDIHEHKFVDTSGFQRCLGRVIIGIGIFSEWLIDGAVPGYTCSVSGQKFVVENMKQVR